MSCVISGKSGPRPVWIQGEGKQNPFSVGRVSDTSCFSLICHRGVWLLSLSDRNKGSKLHWGRKYKAQRYPPWNELLSPNSWSTTWHQTCHQIPKRWYWTLFSNINPKSISVDVTSHLTSSKSLNQKSRSNLWLLEKRPCFTYDEQSVKKHSHYIWVNRSERQPEGIEMQRNGTQAPLGGEAAKISTQNKHNKFFPDIWISGL